MIEEFLELNREARDVLDDLKPVVKLDRHSFYIFSDIHGYIPAAKRIKELIDTGNRVVVLGDYTSRYTAHECPHGEDSIETLKILYEALLDSEGRLLLLRGNHEDRSVHLNTRVSDLLFDISKYTKENVIEIEKQIRETMREMPIVAMIDKAMLMHGGLPVENLSPESFVEAIKEKPREICDSEYYEIVRNGPSYRGRGPGLSFTCLGEEGRKIIQAHTYGKEEVEKAQRSYGFRYIIVGHMHPSRGYASMRKTLYLVNSSYATCGTKRPGYLFYSEGEIVFEKL